MKVEPNYTFLVASLAATILSTSCLNDRGPPFAFRGGMPELGTSSVGPNGVGPNGVGPNGVGPNGVGPNGVGPNGTGANEPNGILLSTLDPPSAVGVSNITIEGTTFVGTLVDSSEISGADFVGATMKEVLPGGVELDIRIDSMVALGDINTYDVSYLGDVNGTPTWLSRCGYEEGGAAVRAFPLSGYWDYSQGTATGGSHTADPSRFTFACRGFAIAKCAEWGYKPWQTVAECNASEECHLLSLAPFHQACMRMVRADYCGDGTPHTVNHTLINLWDAQDIQMQDPTPWSLEATWRVDGAACVRHVRWTTDGFAGAEAALDYIEAYCPNRFVGLNDPNCGGPSSTFYTVNGYSTPLNERTLLFNESEAPPEESSSSSSSSGGGGGGE